jgi:hypothetical protein
MRRLRSCQSQGSSSTHGPLPTPNEWGNIGEARRQTNQGSKASRLGPSGLRMAGEEDASIFELD